MLYFIFLFFISSLFAETFEVLPTQGSGIESSLKENTEALVRNAVLEAGHKVSKNSPQKISTTLMKLGNSYTVVLELEENGTASESSKMKAASAEELDITIQRSVNAILNGGSTDSNDEIGKITKKEEKLVSTRKETRLYKSLGFGPAWTHGLGAEGFLYNFHGGRFWEVSPHWAITLLGDVGVQFKKDGVFQSSVLIGGRFYFTPTAFSPFIGLGAGLGTALSDELNAFGFATGASGGIVLFRTSGTQLELAGNYDIIFDSEKPVGKFGTTLSVNF